VSTGNEEANEPEVLVEQRDRILIITINRPKAKNAVNSAVANGLARIPGGRLYPQPLEGPLGGQPGVGHAVEGHASRHGQPTFSRLRV